MSDGSPQDPPVAIRVDGLRKTFGDGDDSVVAVDDVSFQIERGSLVGLLGPNGAGKTTTIKSLLGLVVPDAGTVEIDGADVHDRPTVAYGNVGAILEGARNVYWRLTVMENLEFFAGIGGVDPGQLRSRHDALLEQFDLVDRADTPVKDLSRGMKQKVSLASTLARDVDVVFMDEPTLGLDVETSLELRSELVRLSERDDVTIVVSSHDMDVIESVCDSVIVLNEGSIVEHSAVEELLEVFRTREFRVTLDEPCAEETRIHLERGLGAECNDVGHAFTITVTAEDDRDLYAVLDVLRSSDREIRDIESLEPDLEEIFLELTETGTTAEAARETPRPDQRPAVAPDGADAATEVTTDGDP